MAAGHLTNTTLSMNYASVVCCDSVLLAFIIAELNDLYILAGDTHNTYLNALTKEKVFLYAVDL